MNDPSNNKGFFVQVTLQDKGTPVYPDDVIAVQHTREPGRFLHCGTSSDSAWRQSYISVPGPELGGWVELGVPALTDGGRWVDDVVCDLRLIYEDLMHLYDVPPALSTTESTTTTSPTPPHMVEPQTPVSGFHLLYPVLGQEDRIHLLVNVQTLIIVKILSGQRAKSTWSAPVSKAEVPFQTSCPSDKPEIRSVCEKDAPETSFSYEYATISIPGEHILNITASNGLNSQKLSVKLQAHVPVTGLSVQPWGFHRVLVDIPQVRRLCSHFSVNLLTS